MLPSEFELVLIDGDNLLHRVRGMRDEAGLRWLLPRLRAWLPPGTRALVMLDGHPDSGDSRRRHVATGVDFQHSGNVDADTAIVGTLGVRPYAERSRTVVVTDDRGLADRARRAGGLVRRLDWLVGGLAAAVGDVVVGAAPGSDVRDQLHSTQSDHGIFTEGIGPAGGVRPRSSTRPVGIGGGRRRAAPQSSRPPIGGPVSHAPDGANPGDSLEREPWKPGRGATQKHGNPKREPKERA